MAIIFGTAGPLPTASIASGSGAIGMGKQTDAWVSEVHGKWYTQAVNGNVFHGSTLVAGTIIPISTATAATFALYNPLGSGVNLELIAYELGISVVTVIATPIGLGFSSSVGGAVAVPTSPTSLTVRNGLLGAGKAPQAQLYSVATVVATTYFKTLFNFTATNATAGNGLGPASYKYDFDGTLLMPPGTLIQTCGLVAPSTSASTQGFTWAEIPI
jgi:hypothetical protein